MDNDNEAIAVRSLHIVVVEDDDLFYAALCRALRRRGHSVFRVSTLAHARFIIDDGVRPDVWLADQSLPDGDGWEYARIFAAALEGMRVVYMSGNPPSDTKHDYFHKGVDPISKVVSMIEGGSPSKKGDDLKRALMLAREGWQMARDFASDRCAVESEKRAEKALEEIDVELKERAADAEGSV